MPRISVVVPIYNVERYLDECLLSLSAQSFGDLEVVMVDDGATDGSAAIAARHAERDPRLRLIRRANHGLGHARNTGVQAATGERTWPAPFLRKTFLRRRSRTHVSRFRWLLSDRMAQSKLWRRSFWDEHGLRFPEGVLHEDIPVVVPAHFQARSVDVVSRPVYLYRIREDGERSITQRRTELRTLHATAYLDRVWLARHRAAQAVTLLRPARAPQSREPRPYNSFVSRPRSFVVRAL